MSLRTITNHYADAQVWDLDPSQRRGPFVVAQEGCAPGDDTATERVFLLRQDGCWVDVMYYLAGQGRDQVTEVVFATTKDIVTLLQRLEATPKVAPLHASKTEVLAWHLANPRVEPGLAGLLQWATEFRRQQAG